MCGIFGSYDFDEFMYLGELNSERGAVSHSAVAIDASSGEVVCNHKALKEFRAFGESVSKYSRRTLYIGHVQAPTTVERNKDWIHPVEFAGSMLWHNGILKPKTIERLGVGDKWDSRVLLSHILDHYQLNDIDGSFSCVMYDRGFGNWFLKHGSALLIFFRNALAPMFVRGISSDSKYVGSIAVEAFSSMPFVDAKETDCDIVYFMDPSEGILIPVERFKTHTMPYVLPEDDDAS